MIETMFIDDLQVHGGTVYGVSQFSIGSPAPRAVTESRPSAHGASDDTRFYGPRTMEVVGRVLATDTASLWPLVDALKGALRLGSWHVLKFRRAGLTYDERALVRVDSPVDIPLVLGSVRMVTFGVSLFAPDPRIYSDTLSSGVYDPTTTTGGSSLTFPVTFPVSFGGDDSSATLDVVNEGNIDTPAVFTITGPVVNPVIVNETTGERITTTGLDLSEGEEVIIDAAARSVNLATLAFPSAAILDDFNRANEGPPPSSKWTTDYYGAPINGFRVSGGACYADLNYSSSYWNAERFGPDIECSFTVADGFTSPVSIAFIYSDIGSYVYDGYEVNFRPGSNRLDGHAVVNGGYTTDVFDVTVSAYSVGDKLGVRLVRGRLEGWHQPVGGDWTLIASGDDATFSGMAHLAVYIDSASTAIDDFRGGNLTRSIGAARPDLIDSSRTDWFELAPGTNQLRMTGTGMSSGATSLAVEYRSARI